MNVRYHETAKTLKEWTTVDMSHQTIGAIVKRVGKAQADEDRELVAELEESQHFPRENV